ncbi:MAG: NERD domain-containing protein [Azoarcus sp.]|jgi:hypothetical protein|nr:NERD domain-containing protein [Azoarcus sp.]
MALFFPDIHSKNLKLTSGERRFAACLFRTLEDDYCCWINVPVGIRQLRPDFIVLHPGRGILTLEVKDWKLDTIRGMDRFSAEIMTDRGLKTEANPLEQARNYAIAIKEMLERDPLLTQQAPGRYHGHLLLPWGYGVVLTRISRLQFEESGLDQAIPTDKVICQDEMAEGIDAEPFQQRLWNMFHFHFGGLLSLARIDRMRWHLFPEIRISQQGLFEPDADGSDKDGKISRFLPELIKVMDARQEKIARNLGEGHRIVHGVAGSGKTLLLAFRCLQLDRMNMAKPILVLCYNKPLAAKLAEMLAAKGAGDNVQVRHFHGWCKAMCDLYQLDLEKSERPIYEKQVEAVIKGAETGRVPRAQYAAILIDEGHDFEPEWFKLLVQMIDPETNSLLLLYDDAQSIYGEKKKRSASWASLGIKAAGRSTILKVNYRNTIEALNFSYQFLSAYIDEASGTDETPRIHPDAGGRNGCKPIVSRFGSLSDELDSLAEQLKARNASNVPYDQMAVLCRFNRQVDTFRATLSGKGIPAAHVQSGSSGVRLMTMHASKGLEFNTVVIPDLGCMPYAKIAPENEAKLLYVAMTRATDMLIVSYHRESDFTRQCERLARYS